MLGDRDRAEDAVQDSSSRCGGAARATTRREAPSSPGCSASFASTRSIPSAVTDVTTTGEPARTTSTHDDKPPAASRRARASASAPPASANSSRQLPAAQREVIVLAYFGELTARSSHLSRVANGTGANVRRRYPPRHNRDFCTASLPLAWVTGGTLTARPPRAGAPPGFRATAMRLGGRRVPASRTTQIRDTSRSERMRRARRLLRVDVWGAGAAWVRPTGELDLATAPRLADALRAARIRFTSGARPPRRLRRPVLQEV